MKANKSLYTFRCGEGKVSEPRLEPAATKKQ